MSEADQEVVTEIFVNLLKSIAAYERTLLLGETRVDRFIAALETGDPEAPWDKKGFKVPGGSGGMHPAVVQTFMAGNAMVAEKTQHNYPAPISIMSCVYEGTQMPMDKGLKIELQYFAKLLSGPVARNMIRTLFIDKGAADKLVRRPEGIPKTRVEKLGILGAGMMGAGIAYVSAYAGQQVLSERS